jgi:hypothetical protein
VVCEVVSTLGFAPVASLAVRIRRRRKPPAVLRVDLPTSPDPDGPEALRFAAVLTGLLSRLTEVSGLDLVAFTEPRVPPSDAAPAVRLVALAQRLEGAGFSIGLVLHVAGGTVARVTGPGRLASPVALGDVLSSASLGDVSSRDALGDVSSPVGLGDVRSPVAEGSEPHATADPSGAAARTGDPHHGPFLELGRVPAELTTAAIAALGYDPAGPVPPDLDPERVVHAWAEALTAPTLPSELAALRLAWPLRHRALRDIVTMQCAWGRDAALLALQETLEHTDLRPDSVFSTFLGASSTAPEPQILRRSVEVLRRVAECSPGSVAAAPLVMLAWLEWCRGRGTVAWAYLDECLRADPACSLAHQFRRILDQGWLPAWLD